MTTEMFTVLDLVRRLQLLQLTSQFVEFFSKL